MDKDVLLPARLNNFFARFEVNTVPLTRPATKTCGLSFTVRWSKTFKRVNPRKAAGPEGLCAPQLGNKDYNNGGGAASGAVSP